MNQPKLDYKKGILMDSKEYQAKLLPLFERYYNVTREGVEAPFDAMAEFKAHNEQYVLVKAAHIADIDSNEFVYFVSCDVLNNEMLTEYDRCAWEMGLSKVKPYYGHRNSDVTLIVTCNALDKDIGRSVRKFRHSATYKMGIHGWSNYRLAVIECSKGKALFNHQGRSLKKLINSIMS